MGCCGRRKALTDAPLKGPLGLKATRIWLGDKWVEFLVAVGTGGVILV